MYTAQTPRFRFKPKSEITKKNRPQISLPWQSFACILYPGRHIQVYEETVLIHFELAGQECFFSKHSSTSVREKEHKCEMMRRIKAFIHGLPTSTLSSNWLLYKLDTSCNLMCLLHVLHASTSIYTRREQNRMEYNITEFMHVNSI